MNLRYVVVSCKFANFSTYFLFHYITCYGFCLIQDLLAHHVIAHIGWSVVDFGLGLIVLSNGFIVHLTVDLHQTDIIEIIIDRSLEGKLLADIVAGKLVALIIYTKLRGIIYEIL